jgi:prophage regulatory protein
VLGNPTIRNAEMGNTSQHNEIQFYRLPQLKKRLNVSGSSIWAWCKKGTFPQPIKLAENTTAWDATDVDAWAQSRIDASK